jgi:hypothetical protein
MKIDRLDHYDAARQEEMIAQWRDWCVYLRAELTLLDARAAESKLAFERAETLEDAAAQAQADLAAIPVARRAVFRAVHEEQRQYAQAEHEAAHTPGADQGRPHHLLDPDEIDRTVLLELLAFAMGEGTDDERGLVPMETVDADGVRRWYSVDVQALAGAPSAAAYDVRRQEAQERRSRLLAMAGLLIGGILFLLIWAFWPSGARPIEAQPDLVPMHNGLTLTPWPLHTLILTSTNGEGWTLPIVATEGDPPTSDVRRAEWRTPGRLPLTLCVPARVLEDVSGAELISGADIPERIYVLRETAAGPTDLILETCASENEAAPARRYGYLQASRSLPNARVGDSVRLSDGVLTVTALDLIGPGDDPMLPQGQAWVVVRVASERAWDWPALNPTVLLADGQALLPGETAAVEGGTELRYLIPLPQDASEVAWSVTVPDAPHPLRWRATLAAPPPRDAVLRERLEVRELTVERATDGRLTAKVTLHNRGAIPLQLTPADLTLSQGGQQLATPDVAGLHASIPAGTTHTVDVPLPPLGQTPLLLHIGAQPFQITLERR